MSSTVELPAAHRAWWSVALLAERFGISEAAVRTMLRRGDLRGKKLNRRGDWAVSAAELRRFERT